MKRWLIVGLLVASLAAAGCSETKNTNADEKLKIAASTPLQWPHVWVADKAGLWSEGGVGADVTLFQDGAQALQSLASGAVDVATAAPTPLVAAIQAGQKIRVIAVTDRWSKWRVVANRTKGIEKVSDLRGKKIGVSTGTAAEVSLNKFLSDNQMTPKDVNIINVAPPNIASALSTGSVDAVAVWVPHIVNAERAIGDKAIAFPYEFSSNYLLVTTEKVLAKKRAQLKKLLGVYQSANKIIADDTAKAAGMVTEVAGIDAKTLADIWTNEFTFDVVAPDDAVRREFEANIAFAKQKGNIPTDSKIPLDDVLVDLFK